MSDPDPEIVELKPGVRLLSQSEAAEQQQAIHGAACPDCGAPLGEHCYRLMPDGKRYEVRLVHQRRKTASEAARQKAKKDA